MLLVIKNKYTYDEKEKLVIDVVKIICVLNKLNLSRGAIQLVTYYILYGVNNDTHKQFVEQKGVKDMQGVYNLRRELKRFNILLEDESTGEIVLSKLFLLDVIDKIGFQLLLELKDEQVNDN